jgi:hypothetical protein
MTFATELEDENVTLERGQDFETCSNVSEMRISSTVDRRSLISDVDAGYWPNSDPRLEGD